VSLPDNGHDTTPSPTPAHHDATTGLHLRAATALVSLRIARSWGSRMIRAAISASDDPGLAERGGALSVGGSGW
jgi:hypothetical protein